MDTISCRYFDGRSTRPRTVTLAVRDGRAIVEGDDVHREESLESIRVSERMGGAARLVSFPDGGYCEVHDQASLTALLGATGHRESAVARLQSRWSLVLLAVAACLGLAAFTYIELLPWAARHVAAHIPDSAVSAMSTQTLALLDRRLLEPSSLPAATRERLADRFGRMVPPDGAAVPHRVVFRASPSLGANAFALPSGTIVVTDGLVKLADDDDEVLAVLTHELGHVHGRHGLRQLLQSSVVGLFVTWYLGDVSSLVAAVPAALLRARYSRDLEREADAYAARMLRLNGMSPRLLVTMLRKLERGTERGSASEAREDASTGYLANHPATGERIRSLEQE
ncbi:MAG: M48 family metalloprotease [Betaproteobacteria bacterium]|nr:M48 family metalloprotease [Betaproteobacteria bacterium]